jgi:hypothetical protein
MMSQLSLYLDTEQSRNGEILRVLLGVVRVGFGFCD